MTAMRILLVEDEEIVAWDIQYKLEQLGYSVCDSVNSGEEAVRRADELRPDLILMDIRLKSEIDGVEAGQRIRAILDIPIVYATAHTDNETLRRAATTHPYSCVFKPLDMSELQNVIEIALAKHSSNRRD